MGFILANVTAAFAVTVWQTGSQLMSSSKLFRLGYVAGASDMLTAVVTVNLESTHERVKLLGRIRASKPGATGVWEQFTKIKAKKSKLPAAGAK